MQTLIGTITLGYLAETGATSLGYADTQAQAIIAARAGWSGRAEQQIRRELLRTLDRDERFTKGYTHMTINGQARRVRVYHVTGAPRADPPAPPVALPADPWRRRQFLGALLAIDPRSVGEAHATAALAALPAAMARLPYKQRERISAVFGLGGQNPIGYAERAAVEQRGALTIRSSIRSGMQTLRAIVQAAAAPSTAPAAASTSFPGDPLFWERVDRSGACWRWTGTLDNGCPAFKRDGKKRMATRYVYELFYGPIPAGHHITHTFDADDPRCVRPDHLAATRPSQIRGSPLRARRA